MSPTIGDGGPLDELRDALRSEGASIRLVHTFTHGRCVQVYSGKGKKVGRVLVPQDGQTLADVLHLLGSLAITEERECSDTCAPAGGTSETWAQFDQAYKVVMP